MAMIQVCHMTIAIMVGVELGIIMEHHYQVIVPKVFCSPMMGVALPLPRKEKRSVAEKALVMSLKALP